MQIHTKDDSVPESKFLIITLHCLAFLVDTHDFLKNFSNLVVKRKSDSKD